MLEEANMSYKFHRVDVETDEGRKVANNARSHWASKRILF